MEIILDSRDKRNPLFVQNGAGRFNLISSLNELG